MDNNLPFRKFLGDSLTELYPNTPFRVFDTLDDVEIDVAINIEQVQSRADELQAEYDALEYARNRLEAYNSLNQFELISDDSINGTTTHKDAILAIKAEFPKP